jgi:hypothetical protein
MKSITYSKAVAMAILKALGSNERIRFGTRWMYFLLAVIATASLLPATHLSAADESGPTLTFSVSSSVSAEDAAYVAEGVALAEDYVAWTLAELTGRLTINVRGTDDTTSAGAVAFSGGEFIVVFTGSPGWAALPPANRIRVVVHEYIHSFQHDVLGDGLYALPAWFIEGMAEYLSYEAVAQLGLLDEQVIADFHAWAITSAGALPTLQRLETGDAFYHEIGPTYSLAYLALDVLMEGRDPQNLVALLDKIESGQTWRSAFRNTFGQSVSNFYASFAAEREDLIAPVRAPLEFAPTLPIRLNGAAGIDSAPRTARPGEQILVRGHSEAGAICRFELDPAGPAGDLAATTFADATGRFFWLVTLPTAIEIGEARITAQCGAEPRNIDLEITNEH